MVFPDLLADFRREFHEEEEGGGGDGEGHAGGFGVSALGVEGGAKSRGLGVSWWFVGETRRGGIIISEEDEVQGRSRSFGGRVFTSAIPRELRDPILSRDLQGSN